MCVCVPVVCVLHGSEPNSVLALLTHHMQDHFRQESVVGELLTERKGRKRVREAMFAIKNASFSSSF